MKSVKKLKSSGRDGNSDEMTSKPESLPKTTCDLYVDRYTSRLLQTQVTAEHHIPFRKLLKDEIRKKREDKRQDGRARSFENGTKPVGDGLLDRWQLTVGLEIHAQLNTEYKLFSRESYVLTSLNGQPNTQVAPFDFALPGSQPKFQKSTLLPALRAALALKCHIQNESRFDRKHYFYADQPAGYQITQYYHPFATNGSITLNDHDGIALEDGEYVEIGIKQVQLEQDTAKTVLQPPAEALLDFNRVGHPLVEIITLPQIRHPQTAAACVKKIQALLQAVNAVTTGMELGGLRADVNVSVRRRGVDTALGQRTEIKNLSSIKAVEDAIIAERNRQVHVLESGGNIKGETRGWTVGASDTVKLRGKEGEVDYRYMPDPDLGPLVIGNDLVGTIAAQLPQLPDQTIGELVAQHGLTLKDAKTLVALDEGERLDYYDCVRQELTTFRTQSTQPTDTVEEGNKKSDVTVANWVLHEIGGLLNTSSSAFSPNTVPAKDLATILHYLSQNRITGRTAKQLLAKKFYSDTRTIHHIISEENLWLRQMSDEEYVAMAREVIEGNPEVARQIREKAEYGKLGFLMGKMMRKGEGRVVARKAEATLKEVLGLPLGFRGKN
ncbi:MAG: hypothetical protein Q9218_007493 [Villophora microphyllina]